MLTLYGRANAWNVRKVLFLLEEIGVPYKQLDYGRGYEPIDTPEFRALNPNAMIPVLQDGDVVLWESHAILRYLASTYAKETYYPTSQPTRAYVEQWLDWGLCYPLAPLRVLFFHHILNSTDYSVQDLENAVQESNKLLTIVEDQLGKTGGYIAGPHLTIADCVAGMTVHRWLNLPIQRVSAPHITRYYEELCRLPSYQKAMLIGIP